MSVDEKKLLEQEAQIYGRMQEMLERSTEWTAEDETNWATANSEYDAVRAQLDQAQAERDRRQRLDEIRQRVEDRGRERVPQPREEYPGAGDPSQRNRDENNAEADRCIAVQAWVRNQLGESVSDEHVEAARRAGVNLNAKELRFGLYRGRYDDVRRMRDLINRQQGTTPDSAGGYTVPETMVRELEIALLDFSGVRQVADVMRTTGGGPMPWPTINDTANEGAVVDENAQVTEQALVFGQVMFGAFKFSSLMVLLSQELIEDNAVNLVAQLGRLLGERIGRKQNNDFTNGDGTATAQGIINCPEGVAAAGGTAITADEIIDLAHSVDPAYRAAGCYYMLHDSTLAAVRKLKDSQGAYIWQPGLQAGTPDLIYGFPYKVNNHMPTIAVNAKTVVFGQMSKYKIRDVAQFRLRRLVERYADYDQEGFVAFQRSDGRLLDAGTGPLKHLVQAAS